MGSCWKSKAVHSLDIFRDHQRVQSWLTAIHAQPRLDDRGAPMKGHKTRQCYSRGAWETLCIFVVYRWGLGCIKATVMGYLPQMLVCCLHLPWRNHCWNRLMRSLLRSLLILLIYRQQRSWLVCERYSRPNCDSHSPAEQWTGYTAMDPLLLKTLSQG